MQDCTTGTGPCSTSESHPGLWEFPLWNVQADDSTVVASMDPADGNITGGMAEDAAAAQAAVERAGFVSLPLLQPAAVN